MEKPKTGFAYIDLSSPEITQEYRPHPASNPWEIYVARLGRMEVKDTQGWMISVNAVDTVYKLITRPKPGHINKKEFVKSKDGKNLAVIVTRQDIVDSLRWHYDEES